MNIKTYVFEDIKKGMEILKGEYGPDAVVVDVKENVRNGSSTWCEISVAAEDVSQCDGYRPEEIRKRGEDIWKFSTKLILKRIDAIESEIIMERLKSYPLPLRFVYNKMIENDFDKHLAMSIISELYTRIGELANETIKVNFFLKELLAEKIKTGDIIGTEDSIVLVGPAGAGKTQTAKKLALMCAAFEKPVEIAVFGNVKGQSYNDLRCFSENNGIPFLSIDRVDKISTVLNNDGKKRILDISGGVSVQKDIVDRLGHIRCILLLPAGTRDRKIMYYIDQFSGSNDLELVFTKLDEEEMPGHICHNLILTGRPVCCFTVGPDIKDVLMPGKDMFYKIIFEGNKWIRKEEKH